MTQETNEIVDYIMITRKHEIYHSQTIIPMTMTDYINIPITVLTHNSLYEHCTNNLIQPENDEGQQEPQQQQENNFVVYVITYQQTIQIMKESEEYLSFNLEDIIFVRVRYEITPEPYDDDIPAPIPLNVAYNEPADILTSIGFTIITNQLINMINAENMEPVHVVASDNDLSLIKPVKYCELNSTHTECSICLDKFADDIIVSQTPCNHVFHHECIKQWITTQTNNCPMCRVKIGVGQVMEEIDNDTS